MKARDLVKRGESAVAIFTRGGHFEHDPDGSGYTGNWVINPQKKLDKVVIYKRDAAGTRHEVYVGTPVEIIDSEQEGRRQIKMVDIRLAGTTTHNWNEFTETKHGSINPIKYISDIPEDARLRQAVKSKMARQVKDAEAVRLVKGTPTVTPSQLGDWRRKLIRLLPSIDKNAMAGGEKIGRCVDRLSREGVLPREIAAMMRTITEMRNATEYQAKTLSPNEAAVVLAAWAAIQEWARTRGLNI